MSGLTLYADFNLFPNGHKFDSTFLFAGYNFVQLSNWSESNMVVKETDGEKGLTFSDEGVEIALPTPVIKVDFRIATYSKPLTIHGLDSFGNITVEKNIPSIFRYVDFQILASTISTLKLTGGRGEAIISRIGIAICVS